LLPRLKFAVCRREGRKVLERIFARHGPASPSRDDDFSLDDAPDVMVGQEQLERDTPLVGAAAYLQQSPHERVELALNLLEPAVEVGGVVRSRHKTGRPRWCCGFPAGRRSSARRSREVPRYFPNAADARRKAGP